MAAPAINLQGIQNFPPEIAAVIQTTTERWLDFSELTLLFDNLHRFPLSRFRLGPEPYLNGIYHYHERLFTDNFLWDPVNQPRRLNCISVPVPGGGEGIGATLARRNLGGGVEFCRQTIHRQADGPSCFVHYLLVPIPVVPAQNQNGDGNNQNGDADNQEEQGDQFQDYDETESEDEDDDFIGDPDYVPSGSEIEDEIDFDDESKPASADYDGTVRVWGNSFEFLKKIDTELFKRKLADEATASSFIVVPEIAPRKPTFPESSRAMMDNLVPLLIYRNGDEMNKARGMLCGISRHSFMENSVTARDLLLTSHLQDTIQHMGTTQILLNRTMAQLGLCAFQVGMMYESHSYLSELYSGQRVRELLSQGLDHEKKTPEQEKMDHMHINLELLGAVHLVCAMVVELPNMAANWDNLRSRYATCMSRNSTTRIFTTVASPEKQNIAFELLNSLDVWKLPKNRDCVLDMVKDRINEEALRDLSLDKQSPQWFRILLPRRRFLWL